MAYTKSSTKKSTTTAKRGGQAKQTCCKKNHTTECATEQCSLSDYDIISDVLGSHKNLVKLYGTALCETDSEQLRKIINSQMTECSIDQFDAFKYMNERNMYKVEPAPAQKIKSARSKFCKCIQEFSCKGSK